MADDARPWAERARKGHEQWASTKDWERRAACNGDERFIQRTLPEKVVAELIEICHSCPVELRCLRWAEAQTQPVGFAVAGGKRWKAWNTCGICGKKVRGVNRCSAHLLVGDPVGLITTDLQPRPFSILDDH